jgi:hypothetical protein
MNKKPKKQQKMLLHFRRLRGDKEIGSFVISLGKIRYFNSSLLLKEGEKRKSPSFSISVNMTREEGVPILQNISGNFCVVK